MNSRYLTDLCVNDCKILLIFYYKWSPYSSICTFPFFETILHYSQLGPPTAPGWFRRPRRAAELPGTARGCSPYTRHQGHSTSRLQGKTGARHSALCQQICFCFVRAWVFICVDVWNELVHRGTWRRKGNTGSVHIPLGLTALQSSALPTLSSTSFHQAVFRPCWTVQLAPASSSGLTRAMQDATQSCGSTSSSAASAESLAVHWALPLCFSLCAK